MSGAERGWLLNLDAELELAQGRNYSPTRRTLELVERQREKCAALTGTAPVFLGSETGDADTLARISFVVPWCPTWRAYRFADRLGLPLVALASPELVRDLTSRRHLVASPFEPVPERSYFHDLETLENFLAARRLPSRLRVKREISSQGRAQRVVSVPPGDEDRRFLRHAFQRGGVLVEPEVTVEDEFSLHGMLLDGEVRWGEPCVQTTNERGAPRSIVRATALASDPRATLRADGERVAAFLEERGYEGPFGVDFLLGAEGRLQLSEVNPRFTLGWATGFGDAVASAVDAYVERFLARAPSRFSSGPRNQGFVQ